MTKYTHYPDLLNPGVNTLRIKLTALNNPYHDNVQPAVLEPLITGS